MLISKLQNILRAVKVYLKMMRFPLSLLLFLKVVFEFLFAFYVKHGSYQGSFLLWVGRDFLVPETMKVVAQLLVESKVFSKMTSVECTAENCLKLPPIQHSISEVTIFPAVCSSTSFCENILMLRLLSSFPLFS